MESLHARRQTRSGLSEEGCACQRISRGELRLAMASVCVPVQQDSLCNWPQKGLGDEGHGAFRRVQIGQLRTQKLERVAQEQIFVEGGKGGMRPPQGYLGTVFNSCV